MSYLYESEEVDLNEDVCVCFVLSGACILDFYQMCNYKELLGNWINNKIWETSKVFANIAWI